MAASLIHQEASVANVKVRYVGTKESKKDTVTGSLTVWFGEGDVQEVDENVAIKLCQFPSVWQLASKPVVKRPKVAEAPKSDDDEEDSDDDGDQTGDSVSVAEIIESLSTLDKDTEFTEAGRPQINAVRERFPDRSVSLADLKEAWTAFTGGE
jgi:hypothetical protein